MDTYTEPTTNYNFTTKVEENEAPDNNFSNEYISYPVNNRYNNAYGNYRGGYDRSTQPPLGFGPVGPEDSFEPPGPSGPLEPPHYIQGDMRWKRGCGNIGPPGKVMPPAKREKLTKYLLRCGIPREHVVNLPNSVLAMMHPMNCGLCAVKFESKDLSLIHYASKNHLKSQKKWVSQWGNQNLLHNREPLKARELYCELCDVQITSTEHADSHYAGKPHRAIVEGRKNPRNPFLLQPSGHGRLKALIRREVRWLKNTPPAKPEKKAKTENKAVLSELHCKICKTSMTCSDQMTTHLNGKRHLAKEKQHILKFMKGEADGKNGSTDKTVEVEDQDEDMDADADADEYGDEDGGEYEGDREGDFDGEGAWEKGSASAADDDWGEGGDDWKPSAEDY